MLVLALAVLAACGGNGTSSPSSGDGGNGNSTSSTSSSGTSASGGGGNSSSGSGGGGSTGVCGPTPENPFGDACEIGDTLECPKDGATTDEFCEAWQAEGLDLCPPDGNKFTINEEGVHFNDCGYDLPKGEHYQMPNECKDFVNGDTWVMVGDPDNPFTIGTAWYAYGQLDISIAGDGGAYDSGGNMSGNRIYWNRFNIDVAGSTEGEFGPDCKTITKRFYDVGGETPIDEKEFVWSHHPGT